MQSPTTLRIRLLGELDIRRGDTPIAALDSARAESLLTYLLVHRDAPQPRQRLAFVLWPDSSEPQARTNLRHVLHKLRRALPDSDRLIEVTPRTLQWRPDAPVWVDLAAFEEALHRAEDDGGLDALRDALDAYTGDLLEGCYDEWLLDERERLRERHLHALERVVALLDERGEIVDALRYAERLLREDPLREATYRRLMRLHDARGDRARALRVYHACTGALERELGVEPSAQTRELYESLLPGASGVGEAHERAAGLVGRAAERGRLTELWRASEAGRAQLVVVTGEPGIGKTRLAEELGAWCAHRGAVTALARSYAAEGGLAYGPVVEWLRSEPIAARRARLDAARRAALEPVLPELAAEPPTSEPQGERERRRRLFDALAHALIAPAQPTLLVADDLQWADGETLQFLHFLIRSAPDAPLLVLATARREELGDPHPVDDLLAGLRALDRVVEVELGRLSHQETAVLADRIAGRALDDGEAERLFAETEGNPLFVVEALRAGWTSPRVQAVLRSRLAQLSPTARDLAGVAATIGREFTAELLAAASETGQEGLVAALDELWRRRIVREQGADAYDFSHDRLRAAAYEALGPARRRRHHLQVARALEGAAEASAGIAAHYDRAGAAREAAPWYERAAGEAQRVYANGEAIRLLERALALVETFPPGEDRDRQELSLLTALVSPLALAEGASAARLVAAQGRAVALARAAGAEPAPPLLRWLAVTGLSRGRYGEARDAGNALRARGERDGDVVMVVESDYVLGIAAFWEGRLRDARRHFEAAVERAHPEHRATHIVRYGLEPGVVCLSRLANTLWFLGDTRAAEQARDRALALAEEIGHPPTTDTALIFAAVLALDLGDVEAVRAYAESSNAGDPEQRWRASLTMAEGVAGWLDVVEGRHRPGLARIRGAVQDAREAEHAPGSYAIMSRVLVDACAIAGDAVAGLAAAGHALATVGAARLWEAETRRRRAEFLAALGASPGEVDEELGRALAVAREQGALALELRARGTLAERAGAHRPLP